MKSKTKRKKKRPPKPSPVQKDEEEGILFSVKIGDVLAEERLKGPGVTVVLEKVVPALKRQIPAFRDFNPPTVLLLWATTSLKNLARRNVDLWKE